MITGLLFLSVLATVQAYAPTVIQIAGVFETESWGQELAFKHATDKVNRRQDILPGVTLSAEVEQIPSGDSFRVQKTVCGLIRTGVAAIFGPMYPASINYVQAVCDDLKIPNLQAVWRPRNYSESSLNVFPHHVPMSQAFTDLVDHFKWESFTILYEDNEGLLRLQRLFGKTLKEKRYRISMRKLTHSNGDFRPVLKELKAKLENRILIDCRRDRVRKLLEQADSLSMLTYVYHYIFTTLDLGLIDFDGFRHEGANITGFRIINPDSKIVRATIREWQREELRSGISPLFGAKYPQTETAMVWDAVHVFAAALQNLSQTGRVVPEELKCGSRNQWSTGPKLTNAMKHTVIKGLTGRIAFDKDGYRTKFRMDVVEIKPTGEIRKIGFWESGRRLNISKAYMETKESIYETLKNKTLKITTIQDKPFIFYAEYDEFGNKLEGNDRFSGYCIDLLKKIKDRIEDFNWGTLNYELHLVGDGQYGVPHDSENPTDTSWNGMVGELMRNEADLALASLTISYIREKVIDFTKPFMNLGISILYRRPDKKDPELFSFLSPLSLYVWVYMVVAYLVVSFMLFTLARFTPYEWHNPYPCQPDSDIVENQFTVMNSLWFTIGSLMQQGSEVAPRAISTRIVSGIWWFFTLIMISSYTANLAAFLTVERMISPIQNAEDLSKQTEIKYGTVISGSTFTFFKTSKIETYSRMWNTMMNHQVNPKTVFVNSTEEGVARVMDKTEPYAYLLESTMNEYFTQRNCELMQVGGLLDSKGYGIGTPRNSPYTDLLSNAILKLQEEQELQKLYDKWWKDSAGAGHCAHAETKKKDANELSVENVGGIFVVLIAGVIVGIMVACAEFVYKRRKDRLKEQEETMQTQDGHSRMPVHTGVPEPGLCSEMWDQFAFALKCTGPSKKYVKRRRRRSSFDELEGAFSQPPPVQTSLLLGAGNGAQPGRELYA